MSASEKDQTNSDEMPAAETQPEEASLDPSPAAPISSEVIEDLRSRAAQADDLKDRWLRAAAELQNAQRRFVREREQARLFAIRELLRALLPSFDNLGRALAGAGSAESKGLLDGVKMVHDEIHRILGTFGVTAIAPGKEKLDPNLHEAILRRPDLGVEENIILDVHEMGYRLGDIVIRPARVTVSAGPPPPGQPVPEGGTPPVPPAPEEPA
jgi:molecular chaperone GrpE